MSVQFADNLVVAFRLPSKFGKREFRHLRK